MELPMCSGHKDGYKCKQRKKCVRCISQPSERQLYLTKPPFVVHSNGETSCEYFWEISNEEPNASDEKHQT